MTENERAIRNVISTWMRASAEGDTQTVLDLMADEGRGSAIVRCKTICLTNTYNSGLPGAATP